MKSTKAIAMTVLLLVIAGAVFAQNNNSALFGTWFGGVEDEELEFSAPNNWEFGGMITGTFSYNGTTLTITNRGRNSTAPATLSGNTLTIGNFTGDTSMNDVFSGRYQRATGGKTINFLDIGAHSGSNIAGGRTTHIEMNLSGTGIGDLTRDDFIITPQGAVTGRLVLQDAGGGTFGLYFDGVSRTQIVTVTIRKAGYTINPPSRQVEIFAGR